MTKAELDRLEGNIADTILRVTGRKVRAKALARAMSAISNNLTKPGEGAQPPPKPHPGFTKGQAKAQYKRCLYVESLRVLQSAPPGSQREWSASRAVELSQDALEEVLWDHMERGECGEFIYNNGFTFPLEDTGAVMHACRDFNLGQGCDLYALQCDLDNALPSLLRDAVGTLRGAVKMYTDALGESEIERERESIPVYHQAVEDLTRWAEGATAPIKDRGGNVHSLCGWDQCECGCKYWEDDHCYACKSPNPHAVDATTTGGDNG